MNPDVHRLSTDRDAGESMLTDPILPINNLNVEDAHVQYPWTIEILNRGNCRFEGMLNPREWGFRGMKRVRQGFSRMRAYSPNSRENAFLPVYYADSLSSCESDNPRFLTSNESRALIARCRL